MSLLFFLCDESERQLSRTPQACIIIPDLLLLHTVGEEGEGGTNRERERKRRGDKDVNVGTKSGAAPSDKAVAMPKSQEDPKHTQQHTCTQSKQGGGWGGGDVTEDDRSILTALTVRTARARQQGRPQEMGGGRCDGRHKEKMFSTSTASPSPPHPHIIQLNSAHQDMCTAQTVQARGTQNKVSLLLFLCFGRWAQ